MLTNYAVYCLFDKMIIWSLLSGDTSVGKSSVAQVFHSDGAHFPKNYTMASVKLTVSSHLVAEEFHGVQYILCYRL